MLTFAVKRGYSDTETKVLVLYKALDRTIDLKYYNKASEVPDDQIPVGVIDWVTDCLGYIPIPNNYPAFMQHMLHRKIWEATEWPMIEGIFIKPSDKPKRFPARITTGTYKGKKKPPYWCSEKVVFKNEWRYYIINGKVRKAEWYAGNESEMHPPELDVDIPTDFCGCIDMGRLSTGEFALVEVGEPYSIGWYGELTDGKLYAEFLAEGWKYLKKSQLI